MDMDADENGKCSDCGGQFVYGVAYKCFVCSQLTCIKHVRMAGDVEVCSYCFRVDSVTPSLEPPQR